MASKQRKRRDREEARRRQLDEPLPEGDDWVEWGGELIWAAGFTSGGAPYGLSVEEFRLANETYEPRAGWALAKQVLRRVLKGMMVEDLDDSIGWVRFVGQGLSYRAYSAECRVRSASGDEDKRLVVRLPQTDAPPQLSERGVSEMRLLEHLITLNLPIRLPRPIAAVPVSGGLALVQEMVYGLPCEMRAGRMSRVRPWEVVAEAAAVCHQVDPEPVAGLVPSHPTRRAHALSTLAIFEELDIPEAGEARDWARANLPPGTPSRLLHGDLLGQNLLLGLGDEEQLGILDWSAALLGDPAYDLAIVTRGVRRPFQIDTGLNKLLDAYNARTGSGLTRADVHLHELCLKAGFYLADARSYGTGSPHAENTRRSFRNLLLRAGTSTGSWM